MRKKFFYVLSGMFFLLPVTTFASECENYTGYDYKLAETFKEKEPDNSFFDAIKTIIPVPFPVKTIEGKIENAKDVDYYLIYLTRPSDFRLVYSGYSGFAPGIVLYNQYKQYMEIKTYASSVRGEFGSKIIDYKIFKPGFYFIKIANLANTGGPYVYRLKITPLDPNLYPWLKKECYGNMINNLKQNKLHEIFYKEIIKKFKNMENYKRFR